MKLYDLLKRTIAGLSAVCMIFSCMPSVTFAVSAQEYTVPKGAVEISSAEEFAEFAKNCVLDDFSEKKYFVLTSDITVGGDLFVPTFGGTFDGLGHTVSGVNITRGGSHTGLFRYIGNGGLLKNLNVTGKVTPNGSALECGGIAGVNSGRIINCTWRGTVHGTGSCGGIAGVNEESGLIASCTSDGLVQARSLTGGICGENFGTVIHCENNASVNTKVDDEPMGIGDLNADEIYSAEQITESVDAGGIAGYSGGSLQGCTNNGDVGYPHVGYNTGGIAGRQDGYISYCINNGTINGRKDAGGIVGQAEPHFSLLFSESTVSKLRRQLDEVNALIDGTIADIKSQSEAMSGETDKVIAKLDEVRTGTDSFLDETDRLVNANVDSLNELSSRLSDLIDMAAPTADCFTEASDMLTESLTLLGGSVSLLEEAGDTADKGFDILFPILGKLSAATEKLTASGKDIDSGLEALQKGMGDEEAMRAALENLSLDFRNLSYALSGLSSSAAEAAKAFSDFKASPEYTSSKEKIVSELELLAEISGGLSDSLEASEGSFRAIESLLEAGVTDIMMYTPYIENILNNFSDGSLSDIFDCVSNISAAVSELVSSEAAKQLGDTLHKAMSGISGGLSGTGNAGQNIGNDIGAISDNTDITSLYDLIKYLREANSKLTDSADPVNGMINAAEEASPYFDEAGAKLIAAAASASDSADKASQASDNISEGFSRITEILDYFAGKEKVTFKGADEKLIKSRENVSEVLKSLTELCREYTESTKNTVQIIADDLLAINDKAAEVNNTLYELADEMANQSTDISDYREDISREDKEGQSDGKIALCKNYGEINGDVSVGGIAGSMAVEYDFDREGDIKSAGAKIEQQGERSLNFMYQSKTVVRNCVNYGKICAKKNIAGGIAGEMDTGCLIKCTGLGDVSCEDGDYAGGAAGKSESAVYGCSSKCRVSGINYVGGIAGKVNDIENCRSFVLIENGTEYVGAVAGNCSGTSEGNIFIDQGIGGIDGISYGGKAYPVSYEKMAAQNDIPAEFKTLKVTFISDGKIAAERECGFGGSLRESDIPKVPEKDGYFAKWEEYNFSGIVFDKEINAVYKKYVTAVSSEEKRENGLPVIVAEGSFTDDDTVTAVTENNTCRVTLPDDGNAVHRIRYIPVLAANKAEITVTENGVPRIAEAAADGSYLVFDVTGNVFELSENEKQSALLFYIISAAALAGIIVLVYIMIKKRKKKIRKA